MFTKRAFIGLVLGCAALFSLIDLWSQTQARLVVDALSDRLECVSYTPFRRPGETPLDPAATVAPEIIEADMALLANRFNCVRTYSVSQGMQAVPESAARHGLKVLLGIWISRNNADNELELKRAIALAKTNRAVLKGIIVGNEVLLRTEQPAEKMRSYIDRVKAAVPGVPVTYADVWEFWLAHPELSAAVDFVTIHILPYWEDRPIAIENAVGHVSHIYNHVVGKLPGKPVMIGETGWPSQGRRRQGAEPSLYNQARFIREFAVRAELEKIPYNVIEAYDQPWKRVQEGTAGGYWGLYDANDSPKFPFRGPVAEAPDKINYAACVSALYFALLLWRWRTKYSGDAVLTLLAISVIAGYSTTSFGVQIAGANRNVMEWLVTGTYGALQVLAVLYIGPVLAQWCVNDQPPGPIPSVKQIVRWLRRNDQSYTASERVIGALRLAFLFGAAFMCLVLFFDPRYRDFPLALYAPVATGLALVKWGVEQIDVDLEEILLAILVGVLSVLAALSEHLITPREGPWSFADTMNPNALLWAFFCMLLAGSVLRPVVVKLRAGESQAA